MYRELEKKANFHKALWGVLFVCWAYWIFLYFTSSMVLVYDAQVFETIGRRIYAEGWKAFFIQGPSREPLYPFMIATSMKLGEIFSVPYQTFQTAFQILFLFSTQVLLLLIFSELKISRRVQLCVLLYFGISPAVVNAAFSLYSEIATFPFVLAGVFSMYYAWRHIDQKSLKKIVLYALCSAIFFLGAAFAKAIFQYIFAVLLVPFVVLIGRAYFKRSRKVLTATAVYVLVASVTLGAAVIEYRYLNKIYNGVFDFTDRYDGNLYGNVSKRTRKLTPARFWAHFVSVPGGGVCRKFFDEETCRFCEFYYMDLYRFQELLPILQQTPKDQHSAKTISLAVEKLAKNPLQYLFLTFMESLKMAFWESTQVGFVLYPPFLDSLYKSTVFKDSLRFTVSFLTYVSLFYAFFFVVHNRARLLDTRSEKNKTVQMCFFVLMAIVPFTGLYALFSILTRFAFPIVSLYFICFALWADRMLRKYDL